jgi:hypothetical protein
VTFMEVIHHRIKIIGRGSGRSAVAAAAYRSGEKLLNARDGMTHDYRRKSGVVFSRILLPGNAPREYFNRERLWNAVEEIEKAKNSQMAREIEFSLPTGIARSEQAEMCCGYVKACFVSQGMCADVAIHDKDGSNPHAHVMLTMRSMDEGGQWLPKQRKEYLLDKSGQKQYDKKKKTYKCSRVYTNDWDNRENERAWHEAWAQACNRAFERLGASRRVTNLSYADQGLAQLPTMHLGCQAAQMEKRGAQTRVGDLNREIRKENMEIEALRQEIREGEGRLATLWQAPEQAGFSAGKDFAAEGGRGEADASQDGGQALQLESLEDQYVEMAIRICQAENQLESRQEQLEGIEREQEDLEERKEMLQGYDRQIEANNAKLGSMGPFAAGRREMADRQERLEQSRRQAAATLRRDYQIGPAEIDAKLQAMLEQREQLSAQGSQLPRIDDLKREQQRLAQAYSTVAQERQAAGQSPGIDEKGRGADPNEGLRERQARQAAWRELKNLSRQRQEGERGQRTEERER